MKLLITRPAVLAGAGGTRSFVPGLTVEVDAQTAQQILERQAQKRQRPPERIGWAQLLAVRDYCTLWHATVQVGFGFGMQIFFRRATGTDP